MSDAKTQYWIQRFKAGPTDEERALNDKHTARFEAIVNTYLALCKEMDAQDTPDVRERRETCGNDMCDELEYMATNGIEFDLPDWCSDDLPPRDRWDVFARELWDKTLQYYFFWRKDNTPDGEDWYRAAMEYGRDSSDDDQGTDGKGQVSESDVVHVAGVNVPVEAQMKTAGSGDAETSKAKKTAVGEAPDDHTTLLVATAADMVEAEVETSTGQVASPAAADMVKADVDTSKRAEVTVTSTSADIVADTQTPGPTAIEAELAEAHTTRTNVETAASSDRQAANGGSEEPKDLRPSDGGNGPVDAVTARMAEVYVAVNSVEAEAATPAPVQAAKTGQPSGAEGTRTSLHPAVGVRLPPGAHKCDELPAGGIWWQGRSSRW